VFLRGLKGENRFKHESLWRGNFSRNKEAEIMQASDGEQATILQTGSISGRVMLTFDESAC
jgi:hypothetical protein